MEKKLTDVRALAEFLSNSTKVYEKIDFIETAEKLGVKNPEDLFDSYCEVDSLDRSNAYFDWEEWIIEKIDGDFIDYMVSQILWKEEDFNKEYRSPFDMQGEIYFRFSDLERAKKKFDDIKNKKVDGFIVETKIEKFAIIDGKINYEMSDFEMENHHTKCKKINAINGKLYYTVHHNIGKDFRVERTRDINIYYVEDNQIKTLACIEALSYNNGKYFLTNEEEIQNYLDDNEYDDDYEFEAL